MNIISIIFSSLPEIAVAILTIIYLRSAYKSEYTAHRKLFYTKLFIMVAALVLAITGIMPIYASFPIIIGAILVFSPTGRA